MAVKTSSTIAEAAAFPPFGEHTYTVFKTNEEVTGSSHFISPIRNTRTGEIDISGTNQFQNAIVHRLMGNAIGKNPRGFMKRPFEVIESFDSGYGEVSIIVKRSGSHVNMTSFWSGFPKGYHDENPKEASKYAIFVFPIDGEKFDRKKISDIRQVRSKVHYVNINIGDYLVITAFNLDRSGTCRMLTFLYKIDDFSTREVDDLVYLKVQKENGEYGFDIVPESNTVVTHEYDVANCKLAVVVAHDMQDKPSSQYDDDLISKENLKRFEGENGIVDYILKQFNNLNGYSSDNLNNLEIGRHMFVYPVGYHKDSDKWTNDALKAIRALKNGGKMGVDIYDDEGELNLTKEQLEEPIDCVPVTIDSSGHVIDADKCPITAFVKLYLIPEVGQLRADANGRNLPENVSKLLMRDFIRNSKMTVGVNASRTGDVVTVQFTFPSTTNRHIGVYEFILDPEVHMRDQLALAFFNNICKRTIEKKKVTYDIVLQDGAEHSHYISVLIDDNA